MPQDEVNQQRDADVDDDIANLPEIRRIQDESGVWYYNVTDVIAALTGTTDASDYWVKVKHPGMECWGL
jgi:hypothetical protein